MPTFLHVLVIEDSESDTQHIVDKLREGGYEPFFEQVDTAAALEAALARQEWEVIISDYRMPQFSGLAALQLVQDKGLDIPFILVSGTIGEEVAAAAMKAGVHDYVMKGNFQRLVPAIQRELLEVEGRRRRRRAEEKVRLLAHTMESISEMASITDLEDRFIYVNKAFLQKYGYTADEILGQNVSLLRSAGNPPGLSEQIRVQSREGNWQGELLNRTKGGREFPIWLSTTNVCDENGRAMALVGIATDITERKQAAEALRDSEARFHAVWKQSVDGMRLLDAEGNIVAVNEAFCRLAGLRCEELEGKPFTVTYAGLRPPSEMLDKFRERFAQRTIPQHEERRVTFRNGGETDLEITNFFLEVPGRAPLLFGLFRNITTRKRAEAALAKEHDLLRTLIDNLPSHIFVKDASGHYLVSNQAHSRLLGAGEESELIGKTVFDFFPPEVARAFDADDKELLSTGIPVVEREELSEAEGERCLYSTTKIPLRDQEGKIVGLVGIKHDITGRKRAEEALRENEERLSKVFQASPTTIAISTWPEGLYVDVNAHFTRTLGFTREEVIGRRAQEFGIWAQPKQRDAVIAALERGEIVRDFECALRTKSGELRDMLVSVERLNLGKQPCLLFINHDITERKQAETRLRGSERQYRRLFEAAQDGILILNADTGMIEDVNPFLTTLLGLTREQVLRERIWDLGCFQDLVANEEKFAELRRNEYVRYENLPLETVDGRRIAVEFVSNVYQVNGGKVVQCNIRDITERKRAEEELRRERKLLRTLIDNLPVCLYVKDTAGRYLINNLANARLLGAAAESEVIGKTVFDFFPLEIARLYDADDQTVVRTGEPVIGREEPFEAGGKRGWFSTTKVSLHGDHDEIVGVVGITQDITERKQAEEALLQRTRLAILGSAVGIALTQTGSLPEILRHCSEALVTNLDAAFARIWTLNEKENVLELQASAGMYTHLNGPHGRVPVGQFKIGLIAQERKPHLTNSVVGDPRVNNQEWAKREGMVAFAGYPLLIEDRVVGVMALFARHSLTEATLTSLGSVANSIALGIEHKRTEEGIIAAEAKFRHLVEQSLVGIYLIQDGRFVYVSPKMTDILGFSEPELTSRPVLEFIAEADRALARENVRKRIEGEISSIHYTLHMLHKGGKTVYVEVHGGTTDYNGRPAVLGTMLDITERARAEQDLRESQALLEKAQEVGHMGSWISGSSLASKLVWSAETCRIFGLAPEKFGGNVEAFLALVHPEDRKTVEEASLAALAGERTYNLEHRIIRPDGSLRWVHEQADVERDAAGQPVRMVGIVQDITERKQAEDVLKRRAEDLERFHRLSIGRELQMIELKREVNELARLAGRTPPYDLSFLEKPV
jgi:PAS domain S-box-containing protein